MHEYDTRDDAISALYDDLDREKRSHADTLNELAHAQRVANNLREELEAVRKTFHFERNRLGTEKDKLEDMMNEYRNRALKAEADLKRANAVIDYIVKKGITR